MESINGVAIVLKKDLQRTPQANLAGHTGAQGSAEVHETMLRQKRQNQQRGSLEVQQPIFHRKKK